MWKANDIKHSIGPNGGGIHASDEHVEMDSLIKTTRIFARTVVVYLKIV
jgi:acetylornithine deacetylase/succinyl-diaminopimelate desuccinylase-like protein